MSFSFRAKIMALVTGALLGSFVLYLFMGTSLMIRDKSSYIYDFNLGIARSVANSISEQITHVQSVAQVLDSAVELAPIQPAFLAQFTRKNQDLIPKSGLLLVRARNKIEWADFASFPPGDAALKKSFSALGLRPMAFEASPILTGAPIGDKLPIAIRGRDVKGKPTVLFTLLDVNLAPVQAYTSKSKIEFLLPSHTGIEMIPPQAGLSPTASSDLSRLGHTILTRPFPSGAQEARLGRRIYLAAYQRVSGTRITVLSLADKSLAFAAASELVRQSIALAAGVLALALMMSMLFAKSVTSRLRELWRATGRIGGGDLSTRVEPARARDEVGDLGRSFNAMAEQIQQLVLQTAEKARMQSELETAQTVQSRFLPAESFLGNGIQLSGKCIPATECAGDWWQYTSIGPYLIVAVGDVTGHGVSSALVTAAAHGTFAVTIDELRARFEKQGEIPSLEYLYRKLNLAVQAAARGSATMTAILSMIDTQNSTLSMINASHPTAYVHRPTLSPGPVKDPLKSFVVLNKAKSDPLGLNENAASQVAQYLLEPGDLILWYTDGLIECKNEEGATIRRKSLLQQVSEIHDGLAIGDHVCSELFDFYTKFLGTNAQNPEDDTTIVVASIGNLASIQREAA